MEFAPKVGPLVAELLSGAAALLIFYYDFHGLAFKGLDELTSGAIVVLIVLAWILGTFFDLIRNQLESIWDCHHLTTHELNWGFFFRGDEKRLAHLEHYYWSFYLLDADMAIAIALSLMFSVCILHLQIIPVHGHMFFIWGLLLIVASLFAIDAASLRWEIKRLLDAEPK
jgi:hypothetical protein